MILLLALAACHTPWEEADVDGARLLTHTQHASPNGRLRVDLEVLDGETSLILSASTDTDHITFLARIFDPEGDEVWTGRDLWESPYNRSTAAFAASTTVLKWPMDAEDTPLRPGRWRFDVRTDQLDDPIDLAAVVKADPTPHAGALAITLYVPDALPERLSSALDPAIAHWRDAIAAPVDLDLDVQRLAVDLPTTLSRPGGADGDTYAALAADRDLRRVPVFAVQDIGDSPGVLGIAGNIPGPLTPTGRTAVTLDLTEGAGRDGTYDAAEIRLLGETMAHEVGHFLGLFHPVELPDDRDQPDHWDALSDTPECSRLPACISTLGSNLMFPAPVCLDPAGAACDGFLPQTDLTPLQATSAHAYPAIP